MATDNEESTRPKNTAHLSHSLLPLIIVNEMEHDSYRIHQIKLELSGCKYFMNPAMLNGDRLVFPILRSQEIHRPFRDIYAEAVGCPQG